MIRSVLSLAVLFGVGGIASAGELDKEGAPAKAGITGGVLKASASELDSESPTDAWHSRGGWGHHHHHHHYGHAGYGYRPYGYGYGGGYNPYAYRPAYYSPYVGYGGYGGYRTYGGFGYGYRSAYVGFGGYYGGW